MGSFAVSRNPRLAFVAEAGGALICYRLLSDLCTRLPGLWAIVSQAALPLALILAWRAWAGETWRIRDTGLAMPAPAAWLEFIWLIFFQTAYLLGILLLLARYRFYSLLGWLVRVREEINGYEADYGPYVVAAILFSLIYLAWGGELLCRGYIQGLGTIRFNAAAGAVISWFVFGAAAVSLALRSGYPLFPDALLWGLAGLLPGPLCEAFYFRNHSLWPLMGARATSNAVAFAIIGLFLYWYPERSFLAALPLLRICLVALIAVSLLGAPRLFPYWKTAVSILLIGGSQGCLPGFSLGLIIIAAALLPKASIQIVFCLAMLTAMRLFGQSRNLGR